MKEKLYTLDRTKIESPEYDPLLNEVMSHLRTHNNNEETKDLPLLEPVLGAENSEKEAKSFRVTKKFVPTRLVL